MFVLTALTLFDIRFLEIVDLCLFFCVSEKAAWLAYLKSNCALSLRSICRFPKGRLGTVTRFVCHSGSLVEGIPPSPSQSRNSLCNNSSTMFYFDEEHENDESRLSEGEYPEDEEKGFMSSRRRVSAHSRPSEGFMVGGWDSDEDDAANEVDETLSQLVPMKMTMNIGTGLRRKRTQSRSKNCSFQDFYSMGSESLGCGAYGSVKTCTQKSSGMEMAVKVVDKNKSGHSRARIMREVDTFRICAGQDNIVQLIDWFEDEDKFYLVFEKMRGGPLLNHIQRKGAFTEAEACKVTKDIATALKFLHDHGIAHRDVKPENILCTDADRVSPVKLCDLDLASKAVPSSPPRLTSVASEPDLSSPCGSAEFMAPEVVDAFVGESLKYDKRCDMWSLGVIVYIMLCGYPPFYGGDCESDNCGWNQGEPCDDCQKILFGRIQSGYYDFPEEEWDEVSDLAKHLISSLLVRDARKRLTAEQVLSHPWVTRGAPATRLQTPSMLFRNDSARDVHEMSEHFAIVSRMAVNGLVEGDENTPSPSPPRNITIPSLFPSPPPDRRCSEGGLSLAGGSSMDASFPSSSLLSCQSAVARVDSFNEMREAQVNV
ncbi:mnk-1 [Pristionchus pacificus]|uniref:Mnk-1 n=1 Tax=Pristionchus pacificus TaxID=54126 RepID=A0A2A6BZ99_PRIPA|nr:mnk-1 [Pristionchus pacificus]|eukprot:PDM71218.1 mnk-1 [Pristionchus pacificus]